MIARLLTVGIQFMGRDLLSQKLQGIAKEWRVTNAVLRGGIGDLSKAVAKPGAAGAAAAAAVGPALHMALAYVDRLSRALVGVFKTVVEKAAEFESTMAMIGVISGRSAEYIAELGDKIIEFSAPLPTSANELAKATMAFARMGLAVNATTDDLVRFGFEAVKFGRAIGVADEEAAMMIANLQTWLGMQQANAETMGRVASIATVLGFRIKGTTQDVVKATERFGAFVRRLGATEAEVLALAAHVKDSGLMIRRGSTAINRTFQLMSTNTDEWGAALQRLGLVNTTREFRELFRTRPVEAFVRVLQAVQNMHAADAAAMLQSIGLHGNYISDIITMSTNLNRLRLNIPRATEEQRKANTTTKAYDAMMGTFNQSLTAAKGAFESLAIVVGSTFLPVLTPVMQALTWILTAIIKLPSPIKYLAGIILSVVTALIMFTQVYLVVKVALEVLHLLGMKNLIIWSKWLLIIAAVAVILLLVVALINWLVTRRGVGETISEITEAAASGARRGLGPSAGAVVTTGAAEEPGEGPSPEDIEALAAQLGSMPGAQRGGIVLRPRPIVVGERGPEAIIPLDRLGPAIAEAVSAGLAGRPAATVMTPAVRSERVTERVDVTVPISLDGHEIARVVEERRLVDRIRRGGSI